MRGTVGGGTPIRKTPTQAPEIELTPIVGINIVPIIDVCLVLLIILLATAPIINAPGLPVQLPKAVTSETKERNLTVSLSRDGRLAVNTEPSSWETVGGMVQRGLVGQRALLVILRADQGVAYGQVERLIELTKRAGAKRIAIATQQGNGTKT